MGQIILHFYEAFKNMDAESMVACYHDEISFTDPAFGTIKGEKAKNMWRMLIHSQKDKNFRIHFDSIREDRNRATAHWEAIYVFSKTGREVHNKIEAEFVLKDGLIYKHRDRFNLHKWATQALGWQGFLLGWTPFFERKLQAQTQGLLLEFEKRRGT
jgi:limonene-1,2-epoxide hydrolase